MLEVRRRGWLVWTRKTSDLKLWAFPQEVLPSVLLLRLSGEVAAREVLLEITRDHLAALRLWHPVLPVFRFTSSLWLLVMVSS